MAAQGPFWAHITYIFSFHSGTGINEPIHMHKNTLHDFFGLLASGLWPKNALIFDILAIYGGSRSFLGDDACSFRFEISSGNNYDSSITIGTYRDFFGPVAACILASKFSKYQRIRTKYRY